LLPDVDELSLKCVRPVEFIDELAPVPDAAAPREEFEVLLELELFELLLPEFQSDELELRLALPLES
jgi:hypothetical protein